MLHGHMPSGTLTFSVMRLPPTASKERFSRNVQLWMFGSWIMVCAGNMLEEMPAQFYHNAPVERAFVQTKQDLVRLDKGPYYLKDYFMQGFQGWNKIDRCPWCSWIHRAPTDCLPNCIRGTCDIHFSGCYLIILVLLFINSNQTCRI